MTLLTETVPESPSPAAPWDGFVPGPWQERIDVRDFVQRNYTPYTGDASFLAGPTSKTLRVWDTLEKDYLSVSALDASTTWTPRLLPTSMPLPQATSARTTTWSSPADRTPR